MATQTVVLLSLVPVMCSAGEPLGAGGLVLLSLNTAADPDLPISVNGIVQPTPESRVRMIGPDSCPVVGYRYVVAYESDDLNGAMESLTADMVVEFRCVTCCEILEEKVAALQAEIDAGIGVAPLELVSPPLNYGMLISGDLTSEGSPIAFPRLPYVGRNNIRPSFVAESGSLTTLNLPRRWAILNDESTPLWTSTDDVASPELVTTWVPQGDATGTPVVTISPGTVGVLGQHAFITAFNIDEVYICVLANPAVWVKLSN